MLQQLMGLAAENKQEQEDSEAGAPELDLNLPLLELYFSRQIHK